jgi:DNA-binding NarL/FixJ family response regulator
MDISITLLCSQDITMDTVDGKKVIRIFIVDAQPQIRRGLAMRLSLEANLEVIGDTGDGQLALHLIEKLHPDLILLDLEMPDVDSLILATQIQKWRPHCPIVMLSLYEDGETRERVLAAGAAAFVSKRQMDHVLMVTIQTLLQSTSISGTST